VPSERIVAQTKDVSRKEFWKRLPRILGYPLRSGGLYILVVGTIFFVLTETIAKYMLFAFILGSLIAGFMCKFYVKVIRNSAKGIETTPSWGEIEFTDFGDIIMAFLRTIGVALFCGAIPLAYMIFASHWTPDWVFFALLGTCIFYFPMALLSVLYYEDFFEINPISVFRSILKVPFRYLVVALVFFAITALGWALLVSIAMLEIIIIGVIIHRFVSLYFYTMSMHLLGMFLATNKQRLGWD